MWQAVLFDPRPLRSPVARNVDSAAGTTAELCPSVHFQLPHSGEKYPRIVRIHGKARAADILSGKKHALPMQSAVHRAVNAALLLWPRCPPKRAGKDNVWIRWVNENLSYAAGLLQPHIGPGLPGIRGFVDSVSDDIAIAYDPSLTGTCPHDAWVSRRDGECADCRSGLFIEDRCPAIAAVCRFPHAAGSCSSVIRARIPGHSSHGSNAVSNARTNKAESELRIFIGIRVRLLRMGHQHATQSHQQCEADLPASDKRHEVLQQIRILEFDVLAQTGSCRTRRVYIIRPLRRGEGSSLVRLIWINILRAAAESVVPAEGIEPTA